MCYQLLELDKFTLIWGFNAHIHDIIGSEIGVTTPGIHGRQISSHFHVLQKIKAVFSWETILTSVRFTKDKWLFQELQ